MSLLVLVRRPDAVPRPDAKVIRFDLERQVTRFSDKIEVPPAPFQGVMGVAPPLERGKLSSIPPYPEFGGGFELQVRANAGAGAPFGRCEIACPG